jgi:phage terminase large subunit-like protein
LKNTKAYEYCKKSVRAKTTPKYVKKQMREFIKISEDKDKRYMINEAKYKQIEAVLKLLIMPKGLKAGQTLYECTTGYQWLIYTAVLCTVYRDNPERRRYETCILEICRKNFKTYTVGTLFIILFITEPKFSEFYSVAPDGKLSREIKEAISKTIKSSPLVYEYKGVKRFKLLRDYIEFIVNESKYTPLNYSNSNMDGKLPNVYCADEVGALPSSYAIEAMQSGQLNILNKLGFIISTKYPTIDNPIEEYEAYAKKVLDGLINDETIFALLYVPDGKRWETNDLVLQQANPVALEVPEIWEDLLKKRAQAIAMESKRENFVTKHCNIIYQGAGTETYIDVKDVQACKVNNIDWTGRVVYLGVDLSESNDNTSVAMVGVDEDDNVLAEVVAFIPEGRIEEKNAFEKIDYKEFIRTSKAIACGDKVIDYAVVEDFILAIEERYGVQVQAIGYDRYNALSTAQKLERAGYNTIEIRQHSSVLHPPTKRLKEKILAGEFQYTENKLLEINFQNARCTYDTNKNLYVNKKKSKGKVDMVVALINAVYLLEQDYFLNQMDFTIQVV